MTPARREGAWCAVLFTLAVLYMSLTVWRGFEWRDEGQILYPSWRVARGAVPYRDFYHLYGPALFMLNGALFRLAGEDLWVTRLSLLVLKATVVVLTYATARAVAGRAAALLSALVVIAVWGAPGWVFTTPYANHYAVLLTLLGLLAFLAVRPRFLVGCALAGACFGMAALFKQTSGLFGLLGFGLYLVWDPGVAPAPPFPGGDAGARVLRGLFLAATLALFAQYLRPANTAWNFLVLFTPAALAIVLLAARELRGGAALPRRGAWGLVAAGCGAGLPVAVCATYFLAHGALGDLVFNTITGTPKLMKWFDPLPLPPARVMLLIALTLVATALERRARAGATPAARRVRVVALAMAAGAAIVLVTLLRQARWPWTLMWIAGLVPFVTVWGTFPVVFPEIAASAGRGVRSAETPAPLALFFFSAVVGLLYFYPAGDLFHLLMSLPLFLPLAAAAAGRWSAPNAAVLPGHGRLLVAGTAALTALLCAPFVWLLVLVAPRPMSGARFAHASGIGGEGAKFDAVAELVRSLESQPADRPLLVLTNDELLYFLSGRDSLLPREEFLLYLVGFNLIRDEDARAHLPERMLIERLLAARPIVVDAADGRPSRFRQVFPETARAIDQHYRPAAVFDGYRVLDWAT